MPGWPRTSSLDRVDSSVGTIGWPRPRRPKVWYRAQSQVGTYADGDPVALMVDIANGYDATPVDVAHPTIFRAGAVNGLAAFEFDGTAGMRFISGGVTLQGPGLEWDVLVVFKTNDAAATQLVFNGDDQTNQPGFARASQYMRIEANDIESEPQASIVVPAGQVLTTGTWVIGEAWTDATEAQTLLDGVGDPPTARVAQPESPNGFHVGYHPAVSVFFDGQAAEIIGFDWKLDDTERAFWMAKLRAEYGL